MTQPNWHIARAAYDRMVANAPQTKDCFNVETVADLCRHQNWKDPRTNHGLSLQFAVVVRKDVRGSFVWQNAMVVNGVNQS